MLNNHQFNNLLGLILDQYIVFGPVIQNGQVIFDQVLKASEIKLSEKTIMPFKNVLYPNGINKNLINDKKIALIGLHSCDLAALDIFYQQFSSINLLPDRKNVLVIASECKPDDDCFCDVFGANKPDNFDLFLQKNGTDYEIFSGSYVGTSYLDKLGLKKQVKQIEIKKIDIKTDNIKAKKLTDLIENRILNKDFWQGIANNCFGCGACTTVCPLCFCIRQNYQNDLNGNQSECLTWDSCFADDFFKISGNFDFKPKNVDRLYNWYHHKFVRATRELNKPLCVGCGRCIKACPANLNIKNILASIEEKNDG